MNTEEIGFMDIAIIGLGLIGGSLARTIKLKTDDFRIPAIRSYLRFGFQPVLEGEGMKERWDKIFEIIGKGKKS